jgi:hypothetical protein
MADSKESDVSEGVASAFRGHDRMDREALDRWRAIAGKGGHDMAPVNMTTLARLIATIDALEALATLSPPLPSLEVERLTIGKEAYRDGLLAAAQMVRSYMGEHLGPNSALMIDVDEGTQADKPTLAYVLAALERRVDRVTLSAFPPLEDRPAEGDPS